MLREHLSQDHDLASRRFEWVDRQVTWIHEQLLNGSTSRILDLACDPGLYSHRLTNLGHRCLGIDFGPASIEYARQHNPDNTRCNFILGDIRRIPFNGLYDLGMILYGELNVFSPPEALAILRKVRASLEPKGRLMIEVQNPQAVESMGRAEPSEQHLQSGLFSDRPHVWRTENRWLPDQKVAIQTFSITEGESGKKRLYRSTTKAWPPNKLHLLLTNAGFSTPSPDNTWPINSDALSLWTASNP